MTVLLAVELQTWAVEDTQLPESITTGDKTLWKAKYSRKKEDLINVRFSFLVIKNNYI